MPSTHYVNAPATTASLPVQNPRSFKTSEIEVSFLCADSTGQHQQGEPVTWRNRITIKSRQFQGAGGEKMVELRAAPPAPIRYTTDGSDPKIAGGSYEDPFEVPPGTVMVLAVAEKKGVISDVHRLYIDWDDIGGVEVDPLRPAIWRREHIAGDTQKTYQLINLLKKHQAALSVTRIAVLGNQWVDLSLDDKLLLTADKIEAILGQLRSLVEEGNVNLEATSVHFSKGQNLLDWVAEVKTEIQPGEVEQP